MSDFRTMSIKKSGSRQEPWLDRGGGSADAPRQLDEPVYEAHEQVEDDPKLATSSRVPTLPSTTAMTSNSLPVLDLLPRKSAGDRPGVTYPVLGRDIP
jgi:hypothetical protein